MFLLAGLRRSNGGRMTDSAFNSQFVHQVQKPIHRSGGFDAYQHRAWKPGIKLPHVAAFVHQLSTYYLAGCGVQHRQRLLASVQITSYNSHSASFGPSAVRVNTETVYSGRREAGLVMTSTGS